MCGMWPRQVSRDSHRSAFLSRRHADHVCSANSVRRQVFSAEPKPVIWKNPVSVLIAATRLEPEVLASAIARINRGDVVGERPFGLASEQKLNYAGYGRHSFSPLRILQSGGKSIMEEGVTPTEWCARP